MYTVLNVVLGYAITVTFICNESQVQEVIDFIGVCDGSAVDIIEQVEANFDCRAVSPATYDPFNWDSPDFDLGLDAVEFLRGEADTLYLFANSKDAFDKYVIYNGLDECEDYEEGGYDLSNYNENTWEHIWDQVDRRRGYSKQFAERIMDLVDAYYSGGSAYVENDIEAQGRLLADALNYVADKLEGEIK